MRKCTNIVYRELEKGNGERSVLAYSPQTSRKHLTVCSTHSRKQELEPTTLMRRKPITFHKSLQWSEAGKHN